MKITQISLLFLLLISGCATSESIPKNSIAGNGRIPERSLSRLFKHNAWMQLRAAPYDAYVVLKGGIRDREIQANDILESYPDESRNDRAIEFAKQLRSHDSVAGSRVAPNSLVYVIFYETNEDPNRAIVFSQMDDPTMASKSFGGDIFLRIWTY